MAEKKPKRASGAVMARVLRNSAGAASPADLEARLHDLRPLQPSAEYVAAANQQMGRQTEGMAGDAVLGAGYDLLPVLTNTKSNPPVNFNPAPIPQGSTVGAEQVARAKAAGMVPPDEVRARMGRVQGSVDPRILAALLRAGR